MRRLGILAIAALLALGIAAGARAQPTVPAGVLANGGTRRQAASTS